MRCTTTIMNTAMMATRTKKTWPLLQRPQGRPPSAADPWRLPSTYIKSEN